MGRTSKEISKEIAICDDSFKYAGKGGVETGVVKQGEGFYYFDCNIFYFGPINSYEFRNLNKTWQVSEFSSGGYLINKK